MFIVIAMMTASACSEPEIVPAAITKPKPKPAPPSSIQISNREFRSTVTTWSQPDGNNYVGIVQAVPQFDLTKARITVVGNGKTTVVDNFPDVTKLSNAGSHGDYYWATIQNNILLLHYVGPTTTSLPPFPLDVIIVY